MWLISFAVYFNSWSKSEDVMVAAEGCFCGLVLTTGCSIPSWAIVWTSWIFLRSIKRFNFGEMLGFLRALSLPQILFLYFLFLYRYRWANASYCWILSQITRILGSLCRMKSMNPLHYLQCGYTDLSFTVYLFFFFFVLFNSMWFLGNFIETSSNCKVQTI